MKWNKMAEERARSASVSQVDRLKEKGNTDVEETPGTYNLQTFRKGVAHRSPPTKKIAQESESNRKGDGEKKVEEREMKRRREPESLEDKLDSLQEILLERMGRVEQKMEDWRSKYQELQATLEMEQKQRAEEKQEREKDRARELEMMKLMQKQIEKLEEKMDELENRSRRVNLVFKGLKEESGETWRQAEERVQELLEKKDHLLPNLEKKNREI